jgi:hypothetical protein
MRTPNKLRDPTGARESGAGAVRANHAQKNI